MKRIETIVVECDQSLPDWLIDAHLKPEGVNGIKVRSFSSGNRLQELEDILNRIIEVADKIGISNGTKMEEIYEILEDASL